MGYTEHLILTKLTALETQIATLVAQGRQTNMELDDLNTALGKLVTDVDTDITALQTGATAQKTALDAAVAGLTAATAADVVDKAAAADALAQLNALKASLVSSTATINALDGKITTASQNLLPPGTVTLPPAVVPAAGA